MNATAIYARVSTDEQKKHGISLDAQVNRCGQYAEAMGLDVVFTGIEGESAKDTDRPELQRILAMATKKRIAHLLIVKADRLSRDVEDSARMGKMFAKKGVTLHLVTEGGAIDMNDPTQEMFFNLRATMGRFERRRISLNTKFALARKRDLGQRISGRAPFGFRFNDEGMVVPDPHEQQIIDRIKSLHAEKYSIRAIQRQLEIEGYKNRCNNPIGRNEIWAITKKAA